MTQMKFMGFGKSGSHVSATFAVIGSPRPMALTCVVVDGLEATLQKFAEGQVVNVELEDNDTGTIHGMKLVAIEAAAEEKAA